MTEIVLKIALKKKQTNKQKHTGNLNIIGMQNLLCQLFQSTIHDHDYEYRQVIVCKIFINEELLTFNKTLII
jgi:hypothetical protein